LTTEDLTECTSTKPVVCYIILEFYCREEPWMATRTAYSSSDHAHSFSDSFILGSGIHVLLEQLIAAAIMLIASQTLLS
jgi:hypothetical protein